MIISPLLRDPSGNHSQHGVKTMSYTLFAHKIEEGKFVCMPFGHPATLAPPNRSKLPKGFVFLAAFHNEDGNEGLAKIYLLDPKVLTRDEARERLKERGASTKRMQEFEKTPGETWYLWPVGYAMMDIDEEYDRFISVPVLCEKMVSADNGWVELIA